VEAGEESVDDPAGDDLDAPERGEGGRVEQVGARGAGGLHAGGESKGS
jgi:hypothetical protein